MWSTVPARIRCYSLQKTTCPKQLKQICTIIICIGGVYHLPIRVQKGCIFSLISTHFSCVHVCVWCVYMHPCVFMCECAGADTGGALGAQAPPLSKDNIPGFHRRWPK